MFLVTTATKKIRALTKKIRAVQGGTSASKTISILLFLIALSQSDEVPKLGSIVSESMPQLKRGALRDFKNIMKTQGYWDDNCWHDTDKIYTFETGSQIEFFGADEADRLRGGRRDRLFINEANNISLMAFDELEVRTRDFVFIDWNPTNEFWFYTEVLPNRDDVELIVLTYKDNEALDESTINSIEQRMNRPGWWKVYGEGQLGEVEGKIYKGWKIIDEVPHEARLERYWIDFGYSQDPASIGAVYSYNGGFILHQLAYELGMSNKMIADVIKATEKKALVIADSSEPKSIADIRLNGVTIIGAVKGPDSIDYGIKTVQGVPISITKSSVETIKEYRNYLWKIDKTTGKILDVPEDGQDDHSMDGIRYVISSLRPKKDKPAYKQKDYEPSMPYSEPVAEDKKDDLPMRDPWKPKRASYQQQGYESSSPFTLD